MKYEMFARNYKFYGMIISINGRNIPERSVPTETFSKPNSFLSNAEYRRENLSARNMGTLASGPTESNYYSQSS